MFLKYNLSGISWALFILALCGLPGNRLPDLSYWNLFSFDKIVHAFLFAILVTLLIIGFKKQYLFVRLRYYSVISSVLIGILYGAFTEVLQTIVFVERTGDIYDFIANAVGCLLGIILFRFWKKHRKKLNYKIFHSNLVF